MDPEFEIEPSKEASESATENMVEIIVGILKGLTDDPSFTDLV